MSMRFERATLSLTLLAMAALTVPAQAARPRGSAPELVYATMALGQTTGITNVYQVNGSGATLVATLPHGGGGPLAVDANENMYVVQAAYDDNAIVENSRVFVYARGASKPTRSIYAKGFSAEAMTVAPDGTLYMAGQEFPNTNVFAVLKFPPHSRSGAMLPADPRSPVFPIGMSLDEAGDLFVGWIDGSKRCSVDNLHGCVDVMPAGQNAWQLDLPAPSAANSINGGPIARPDGSLILFAAGLGYTYLETVPPHRRLPSQVISLPVLGCCSAGVALVSDAAGKQIWGFQVGLGSTSTAYAIDYPGGKIATQIPVSAPGSAPFIPTGMAVSPAYYPGR